MHFCLNIALNRYVFLDLSDFGETLGMVSNRVYFRRNMLSALHCLDPECTRKYGTHTIWTVLKWVSRADRRSSLPHQDMHRELAVGCGQLADLQLLLGRLQQLVTAGGAQLKLARLRPQLVQMRRRLQRAVTQLLDCQRRLAEVRANCDLLDGWLDRTEERCGDRPLVEEELEVREANCGI